MLEFIIFTTINKMNVIDMPDEPQRPKRQLTALERLHEEMQRPLRQWEEMQRPLRQWEEMQRQLPPLRHLEEIQEQMRRATGVYQLKEQVEQYSLSAQLREILEQSMLPRHVQDLLDKGSAAAQAQRMLEQYLPKVHLDLDSDVMATAADGKKPTLDHPFGLDNNAIAAAANAMKSRLNDQFGFTNEAMAAANAMNLATAHQEWFNRLQLQATGGLSLPDLASQLGHVNPALKALEEARRSLGNLAGAFRDFDLKQLELDEQEEQEAELAVEAITEAAATELTLPAAVAQIITAIEAQQNPAVRFTLWQFFLKLMDWIIAGIIGAIISQQMPPSAPQSPPQAVKSIKGVARATVNSPALLTEYRIVTAKTLSLRQNPKSRSPQLGQLGFGKIVKLLKKDRDFALVLWRDTESGTEIQGWVFARYLEKFN